MLLTLLLLVLVVQVILRRMSQEFQEEILLHLVILPTEVLEAVTVRAVMPFWKEGQEALVVVRVCLAA